jgi:phage baseplate assembly protein gpV
MALENDPAPDESPRKLQDVRLDDGEIIVYDPDVEEAWVQGDAVTVEP